MDAEDIRRQLTSGLPTVAMALFPVEEYIGSLAKDLFAEDDSTYSLINDFQKTADWVEVVKEYYCPMYGYKDAEEDQTGGVIIHYRPDGEVTVHERLVKTIVETDTSEITEKEKPEFSKKAYRYAATQKNRMVQTALMDNIRKAKEVDLLQRLGFSGEVDIKLHKSAPVSKDVENGKQWPALQSCMTDLRVNRLSTPVPDNDTDCCPP